MLESFQADSLYEVELDEPIGSGRSASREDERNRFVVTSEEEVIVKVSGEEGCRFQTSLDQRIGLWKEHKPACRRRRLILQGPRSKTLEKALAQF